VYGIASLLHFSHNAEYLSDYPNLPAWLTQSKVYAAWLCIFAIGAIGYTLHHRGNTLLGLMVIGVYAAIGLDGLLHYGQAPFAQHTVTMNATILFEVSAAALLLVTVGCLVRRHLSFCGRLSRVRAANQAAPNNALERARDA
jgi:hypothetical protein